MSSTTFDPPKQTGTSIRDGTEKLEAKAVVTKITREFASGDAPASKEDIVLLKRYFLVALAAASSIIILVAWLLRH